MSSAQVPATGGSGPASPAKSSPAPASPTPASPAPASLAPLVDSTILPPSHWQQLADMAQDDDADSLAGYSDSSSTASLASSIRKYRMLHGRTYHGEVGQAEYWAANDDPQSESQELIHYTIKLALDGNLFLAPLKEKSLQKALDVGTGNGMWAIDFADQFPGCEVIATDISPIQPSWVPPNLKFEMDDCTQEWTFTPNSFDYIHLRWLFGSIADWSELFAQAYRACRPGGWVETFEPESSLLSDDGSVTSKNAHGQWGRVFTEGGNITGRTFDVVPLDLQKKGMEEAGFIDIQERVLKFPIGDWETDPKMKQLGMMGEESLGGDTEGYLNFIANTLGWSREEILVFVAVLRREIRDPKIHGYYNAKVVWGRKPE